MDFYKPNKLQMMYVYCNVYFIENFLGNNPYNIPRNLYRIRTNDITIHYCDATKYLKFVDKNLVYDYALRNTIQSINVLQKSLGRKIEWKITDEFL